MLIEKKIGKELIRFDSPYDEIAPHLTDAEIYVLSKAWVDQVAQTTEIIELVEAGLVDQAKTAARGLEIKIKIPALRQTPLEKEATRLATNLIKYKLAETGRKITDVPADTNKELWDALITENIVQLSRHPDVISEARENLKQK